MKFLLYTLLFFYVQLISAQSECDCTSELNFVIDYYEKNLPGFNDNVTPENLGVYNSFKNDLTEASKKASNKVECYKTLTYYVEFFKDNHSKINMTLPIVDDKDEQAVNSFLNSELFKSRETYNLTENDLKQYPESDIRGIYRTPGDAYTIAIVPSKTPFRDYVGVIIESKTKLWKKGQVKLELKLTEDGSNTALVYLKNHSLRYYNTFPLNEGILGDIWFKTSKKETINPAMSNNSEFNARKLNDTIAYIKIPTFSGSQTAKINELYNKAKPIIESTPYLIIDVRDNGGGSDSNAMPLLEYMYTKPIVGDKVDLYVTEGNIKVWEDWYSHIKNDTINYNKETREWFVQEISKMKSAKPNSFLLRSKNETLTMDFNLKAPKKIAIIQNRNCASSCETLLFWAKQSDKTILVGENSGGYVGYGEVGSVKTPCFEFDLYCTMTRYEKQREYEVIGISPNNYLSYSKDWIEQTIELLSN